MSSTPESPRPSLIGGFRAEKKSPPLHGQEIILLILVGAHLCFLPWALGTMHAWSQQISLIASAITLGFALWPRHYTVEHTGGPDFRMYPASRLLRFPIFWIGLALLAYIVVQGLNPSWVWERNEKSWWLRRIPHISWLPTSVETPYERFNLWRQFIIYASAFMLVCTIWIGFTRKKTLEMLCAIIAGNGLLLALVGLGIRMWRANPTYVLWFEKKWRGATSFASFIYRNHAGAFLALAVIAVFAVAAYRYERDLRRLARSTSAVVIALAALPIGIGVVYSYSRGATLLLAAYLVVALLATFANRLLSGRPTTHPGVQIALMVLVTGLGGFTLAQLDFGRMNKRLDQLFEKGEEERSVGSRLSAHEAARDMLEDHWSKGTGAGSFRYLFPQYIKKYPTFYRNGRLFWEHAHNDWLQLPIELGAGGITLLGFGAIWTVIASIRNRIWRNLPALLVILGLAQTLVHAAFDFPFQNPAILCTWLALLFTTLRHAEIQGR